MMKFSKATKTAARLRAALIGPSGSGKTYSALAIAAGLGQRVAVIDTERGSASKYAGIFAFDVLELETFAPRMYVEALGAAVAEGYDVVVIDSLSHAWMGAGGALEMVDRAAKSSGSRNSFDAWRSVTPEQNKMVDAILRCSAHVIVTMRSKTEYVIEEDSRGKKVPRKVGLAPVQRQDLEYEFDVVAELNAEHGATITKTRCPEIADAYIEKPGAALAKTLRAWLTDGAPAPAQPGPAPEFAAFVADLEKAELPGEVTLLWRKHRAALSTLSVPEKESAWQLAHVAVATLGKMKDGKVWLKRAVAEEDARAHAAAPESDPSLSTQPGGPEPPATEPLDDEKGAPPATLVQFNESVATLAKASQAVSLWRNQSAGLARQHATLPAWKELMRKLVELLNAEQPGTKWTAETAGDWLKREGAERDARAGAQ